MTTYNLDKIKDSEEQVGISQLRNQIKVLAEENLNLRKTLQTYGIEELETMSEAEAICVTQISRLKEISQLRQFDEDEVRAFDILVKNILAIRGKDQKKSVRTKIDDVNKLIELVRSESAASSD